MLLFLTFFHNLFNNFIAAKVKILIELELILIGLVLILIGLDLILIGFILISF